MNKKQKLVFVISQQGDSGKTYIATNIIDQARQQGIETAGYLLDIKADALIKKLGERTEEGEILRNQDPLKGISIIDIANQNGGNHDHKTREKEKLFKALEDNVELSVFDFPGQGDTSFKQHFDNGELETVLETADKEILVVIPVANSKSLDSVGFLKQTFTFSGEFEFLNDNVKFLVAHNPTSAETDLSYEKFLGSKEHKDLLTLGDRYQNVSLLNINKNILNLINDKPFSYYIDLDKRGTLIADRIPSWVLDGTISKSEFLIQMRRILTNDTGFYQVVKNYII